MSLKTKSETPDETLKFSKAQLVKSKRYSNNVDLVNALLKEYQSYSFEEVDGLIENFMKGKVK